MRVTYLNLANIHSYVLGLCKIFSKEPATIDSQKVSQMSDHEMMTTDGCDDSFKRASPTPSVFSPSPERETMDASTQDAPQSPQTEATTAPPKQDGEPENGNDDMLIEDAKPERRRYVLAKVGKVENPSNYNLGGFHPVKLGDYLDSEKRYRVVHKLGNGGFATIWLCRDSLVGKWRAVKIMAASASDPEKCSDLRVAQQFANTNVEGLAHSHHLSLPIDYFWIDGPNGRHLCTVMPLLGPRIDHVYQTYGMCPSLLKDICLQAVKGLRYLHHRGFCHADFRPQNILFQLADGVDELPEEDILEIFGTPKLVDVWLMDEDQMIDYDAELEPHCPPYLVERARITYSSGLCSRNVTVTDLGISYPIGEAPICPGGIPLTYASPEEIFAVGGEGPASDIWALGCTIAQIHTGSLPFGESDDLETAVTFMEEIAGPMPEPYRTAYGDALGLEYKGDRDDLSKHVSQHEDYFDSGKKFWRETYGIQSPFLGRLSKKRSPLSIISAQAAQIEDEDYRVTGRLPGFTVLSEEGIRQLGDWGDRVYARRDEKDTSLLFDLLKSIFRWDPSTRSTATEIVNHKWFKQA